MARFEFRFPDPGEGTDDGEVVEWHVAVGGEVIEDAPLVDVQTDKAIIAIPCPVSGRLLDRGAEAGATIHVGALLAVFETAGDGGSAAPPPGMPVGEPAAAPEQAAAPRPAARPMASPAVRRRARELGIDLTRLRGSGPQGRILAADLTATVGERESPPTAPGVAPAVPDRTGAPPRAAPGPGTVVPLTGVRRSIARTLTHAWQTIPHVIDYREVDAEALLRTRAALKADAAGRGDERLAAAMTMTPLLVKVAAVVLRAHPYVNASIDLEREEITHHERCSIGIAAATPAGLMVPVVHDADAKSIAEIALEVDELVRAARDNRLRAEQISGGTFTVNNYGGLGIWLGTPIIKPPEVANLGIGAIREQVVPVDGQPAVRRICAIAASGDHRILDGDTLAAFVTDIVRRLTDPVLLLADLR